MSNRVAYPSSEILEAGKRGEPKRVIAWLRYSLDAHLCDGDKTLIIKDRLLTSIAKRNMKDIVPLAYDLKKAKAELLTPDSMYQGMAHAYTGSNIGIISNNITKVWNSENIGQEQLDVVKWLTFQNNAVIDYAKTLWLPTPPKEVEKIIHSYTKAKVPDFFIYAKDKEKSQVEKPNNSVMNRIAKSIPDGKIKFNKSVSKFDYSMLMNKECDFTIDPESPVIKAYDYWNLRGVEFTKEDENIKGKDLYVFKKIRENILKDCGKDINYVTNTLVAYLYTVRYSSAKKRLWECFGDVIVENLKKNLENKGKICPICGKRFMPSKYNLNTRFCSDECFRYSRKEYFRLKKQEKRSQKNIE